MKNFSWEFHSGWFENSVGSVIFDLLTGVSKITAL